MGGLTPAEAPYKRVGLASRGVKTPRGALPVSGARPLSPRAPAAEAPRAAANRAGRPLKRALAPRVQPCCAVGPSSPVVNATAPLLGLLVEVSARHPRRRAGRRPGLTTRTSAAPGPTLDPRPAPRGAEASASTLASPAGEGVLLSIGLYPRALATQKRWRDALDKSRGPQ